MYVIISIMDITLVEFKKQITNNTCIVQKHDFKTCVIQMRIRMVYK